MRLSELELKLFKYYDPSSHLFRVLKAPKTELSSKITRVERSRSTCLHSFGIFLRECSLVAIMLSIAKHSHWWSVEHVSHMHNGYFGCFVLNNDEFLVLVHRQAGNMRAANFAFSFLAKPGTVTSSQSRSQLHCTALPVSGHNWASWKIGSFGAAMLPEKDQFERREISTTVGCGPHLSNGQVIPTVFALFQLICSVPFRAD